MILLRFLYLPQITTLRYEDENQKYPNTGSVAARDNNDRAYC